MVTLTSYSSVDRLQRARQLAIQSARVADEHRGEDIVVLDMTRLTPIVDFFVLVTASTPRRMRTIVDEIDRTLKELGEQRLGIEGYGTTRWVLLDYGDIVIHVFSPDARQYYDLDNLWADAPRIAWQDEGGRETSHS